MVSFVQSGCKCPSPILQVMSCTDRFISISLLRLFVEGNCIMSVCNEEPSEGFLKGNTYYYISVANVSSENLPIMVWT